MSNEVLTILVTLIGVAGTICAIAFGYLAFSRGKGKDTVASGKQDGMVLTEIGYIKSGVDDIKSEQREQRKMNIEILTRLSAVEQSAKQAHHRIDRIEKNEA